MGTRTKLAVALPLFILVGHGSCVGEARQTGAALAVEDLDGNTHESLADNVKTCGSKQLNLDPLPMTKAPEQGPVSFLNIGLHSGTSNKMGASAMLSDDGDDVEFPSQPCTVTLWNEQDCDGDVTKTVSALTFNKQTFDWRDKMTISGKNRSKPWISAKLSKSCVKAEFAVLDARFKKLQCKDRQKHGFNFCSDWCGKRWLGCGLHTFFQWQGVLTPAYNMTCHCLGCNGCPMRQTLPLFSSADRAFSKVEVEYDLKAEEDGEGCRNFQYLGALGVRVFPAGKCKYMVCSAEKDTEVDTTLSCHAPCEEKQCCVKFWTCESSALKCPAGQTVQEKDENGTKITCRQNKCKPDKCCFDTTCGDYCSNLNKAANNADEVCKDKCDVKTCCGAYTMSVNALLAIMLAVSLLRDGGG